MAKREVVMAKRKAKEDEPEAFKMPPAEPITRADRRRYERQGQMRLPSLEDAYFEPTRRGS